MFSLTTTRNVPTKAFSKRRPGSKLLRSWRVARLVIGAFLLFLSVSAISSCNATSSGNFTYELTYHSGTADDQGIYLADGDGKHIKRITNEDTIAFSPTWSPDGTRIAFVGQLRDERMAAFSVYILTLSDLRANRFTDPKVIIVEDKLTWSPDGRFIAFADTPVGNNARGLYLLNVDNKQLTRVAEEIVRPSWSPNGDMIAGSYMDTICLLKITNGSKQCLDLATLNNTNTPTAQSQWMHPTFKSIAEPFWFSDSSRIGFIGNTKDGYGIYAMNLDGSDLQEILNPVQVGLCYPSWIPANDSIAIARCAEQAHGIYILESGSSRLVQLSLGQWADSPSWKPSDKP